MRPVFADAGETAQFLAMKGLTLNSEARDRFLDWLYEDLAAALRKLIRVAQGDYRDDKYAERFPRFAAAESGETPQQLFEKWVAEKHPAWNTEAGWKGVFTAMTKHFEERSAASITPDQAQRWVTGLIGPKRSARTVDNNYISASKTVFGWAVEHKRIARNPFATVKVTIPRPVKLREKSLRPDECRTILVAALGIVASDTGDSAARRWVPWLCAYTGARPGEITQLRGSDVVQENGIPAIRITPDAGSVKGREPRVVPLHDHLIEQDFLKFVAQRDVGPLFYNPDRRSGKGETERRKAPRSVLARQRLAHWVRGLGITEKGLSPLHGWRHTFKRLAARAGIEPGMRDAICGHSPRTVADEYETPTLEDMAAAMKKFP
jgi:integrase